MSFFFFFFFSSRRRHTRLTCDWSSDVCSSDLCFPTFVAVPTHAITLTISAITSGAHLLDRKSTRLNSSHMSISYAVFCLKKKTEKDVIFDQGHATKVNRTDH